MWKTVTALILVVMLPGTVSAGPIREAAEAAGRTLAREQQQSGEQRSRSRFWTGLALLVGGGVLASLGSLELGDDETGPDDAEDLDSSDDGEDSDGWGNKALIGGGIAAATAGGVVLITGRKSGPAVSAGPRAIAVRHTLRF